MSGIANDANASNGLLTGLYYENGQVISQKWHPSFVVFAFVIAFVSSYMAVHLLDHDLWRTDEERQHSLIKYPRSLAAFILGFGTVW